MMKTPERLLVSLCFLVVACGLLPHAIAQDAEDPLTSLLDRIPANGSLEGSEVIKGLLKPGGAEILEI